MTTPSPAPSERIVDAVAAAEDVSPTELEPRLGEVIDADALNKLVDGHPAANGDVRVSFTYGDHVVTVRRDASIELQ